MDRRESMFLRPVLDRGLETQAPGHENSLGEVEGGLDRQREQGRGDGAFEKDHRAVIATEAGEDRLAEPAGPDPSLEVTVVPGVPRYHSSQCILIRFMGEDDLDTMTVAAARWWRPGRRGGPPGARYRRERGHGALAAEAPTKIEAAQPPARKATLMGMQAGEHPRDRLRGI